MTTSLSKPERFLRVLNENCIEADGMDNCNPNPGYEDEGPPSYGTAQRQDQERNRAQFTVPPCNTRRVSPSISDESNNIRLSHEHESGRMTELSIGRGTAGINLIVGNNNAVNIGNSRHSPSPPPQRSLSPPEITDSEEMVSVGMGQYVSSNLGSLWKRVGRILGLSDADLDYIESDNQMGAERAYDMIRKWRQSRGRQASYKALAMALVRADPRLYKLAAMVNPNGIYV